MEIKELKVGDKIMISGTIKKIGPDKAILMRINKNWDMWVTHELIEALPEPYPFMLDGKPVKIDDLLLAPDGLEKIILGLNLEYKSVAVNLLGWNYLLLTKCSWPDRTDRWNWVSYGALEDRCDFTILDQRTEEEISKIKPPAGPWIKRIGTLTKSIGEK